MIIKDSVVLITSAGTTLGAMLAIHFSRLGAHVFLCDTDASKLHSTYVRCKDMTHQVEKVLISDISMPNIEQLFNAVEQKSGKVPDVLVNHWLSLPRQSLTDTISGRQFITQFSLLASSLFMFGQVAAERMSQGQSGVIVNVVAQEPNQNLSDLDNTMSMVSGFTKSWAKELEPHNVRVGGVIPMKSHNFNISGHWAEIQDELTRTTEYIVTNDYFSGRVVSTEA
ncbi:SDR family oxidoreductase [Vibrio sp. ZSDZ65]|uniref:SDR family oxidoreductase n=1 Tax=Vibrio qingdaonensis TaxID=2829491 RepID=A0A9X3CPB0_9VIBR|nr:SDR family oxidoreductase [Vibrio qingdaonensis]MCW8346719.1 SDR family oxidoreductase [Vibrio qingdaonensis]